MNNQNAPRFAAIPGAFITFDPNSVAKPQTDPTSRAADAKKRCGNCALCKCKRAKG